MSRSRTASSFAAALLLAGLAHAVPPDVKVSTDDLNDAGEQSVELQANKARGWPFQMVGEYSYSLTDHWQLAAKAPLARDGGLRALGGNVELRYLGAHDRERGGYWGLDVSAGRERERYTGPYTSSVELQPVLGYRAAGWHLALNVPLAFPSSGPDRRATLGLAAKAGRRLGGQNLALEYFLDAAPLRDPPPHALRPEYLFLAWDDVGGRPLNLALGRGLTDASERWVVKVVYSIPIR